MLRQIDIELTCIFGLALASGATFSGFILALPSIVSYF